MRLLTFLLTGPLQSWGGACRWDYRMTEAMPTKSAIIGMLGCCLGYSRGDARLKALSDGLRMAVRADCPGRVMMDYQTVQKPGGWILNAEGKERSETIIAHKQYLQDAAFQVFLAGDEAVLEECARAMRNPRWAVCLGRRSCPPTRPILPRLVQYDSMEAALREYFDESFKRAPQTKGYIHCQIECASEEQGEGQELVRMDNVLRADRNAYMPRHIRTMLVRREG